ncbi:DUF550 domain-containing protein [Salmonella enterica]
MTTITRERLLKIQQWRETYGTGSNVMLPAEEAEELARIALASLTAEPVAWTDEEELRDLRKVGFCEMFSVEPISKDADMLRFIPLYRHAQPAPEREQIRREHAEWSDVTFGDVGPVGPLKHLSKEALESAAEPGDLSEWADMQFLLWDAQRRAGISDEQITQAMVEKLAVNKQREWPEPKDGEPRLHIKEQPAPVVPDGLRQALSNAGIAAPESDEMLAATCEKYIQMLVTWVKDRKPFQPAPVVPEVLERLRSIVADPRALPRRKEWISGQQYSYVLLENVEAMVDEACRAAMLQSKYRDLSQPVDPQISEYEKIMLRAGNSPVIPDGYALVPVEPTDEMIVAAMDSDDVTYNESDDTVFYVHHCEIYKAMLAAAPQPETNNK